MNHTRRVEEQQRLKNRYGEDQSSESSDSQTSSDEDPEVSQHRNMEFLSVLAAIKSKDDTIYDSNVKFFNKANDKNTKKSKQKPKLTLAKYDQKFVEEQGGMLDEEKDTADMPETLGSDGKAAAVKAFQSSSDEDESDGEELLTVKSKTKDGDRQKHEDFVEWMKGGEGNPAGGESMQVLKKSWNGKDIDENEKFLRIP